MSERKNMLDGLENQLEKEKQLLSRRRMALRLADNPDFKQLILREFMVEESARYVHTSCDPAVSPENRADALALAQAAGHLKRYLSVVVQMGARAENEVPNIEEAIEQLRAEGDD